MTEIAVHSAAQPRQAAPGPLGRAELRAEVRATAQGHGICVLSLPGIRCGGCVALIERTLTARDDVVSARVNLTLRRANITLASAQTDPTPIIAALDALGYAATPAEMQDATDADPAGRGLLRAMAVAGFGAANIMILSVAVWAGATGHTRETFHLISALIALPVVVYAGQPFYRSALRAVRAGRLNMDVPIALAVLLALALSLFETWQGGDHVFFDAAVTLLFFLLTGRYLDHLMRARARSAVTGLARLMPRGAMLRADDGTLAYAALDSIAPGATLAIAAGERVPVDARIVTGHSDLDRALVTGESMPVAAGPGDTLEAGTLNLTGPVEACALRAANESFLAQMMQMQAEAETAGRGGYVRIADRAARLYAPVVHLMALATFIGWVMATGGDWQASAFVAISVLIITCPCALGLAVPVAHVVAAGKLMRMGIMMKDGGALERLAGIDRAVFDKTGTLTTGTPAITTLPGTPAQRVGAATLARHSHHPAARAIAARLEGASDASDVNEQPGYGVEGMVNGCRARLGRAEWVGEIAEVPKGAASPAFAFEGGAAISFDLTETLRPGAAGAIATLAEHGIASAMLSGDMEDRARRVAQDLGIGDIRHGATPAQKIEALEALRRDGHHPLMVGDGLNDAAALAAAHVSMAPASASDAGRTAADLVFLREGLDAVPAAWLVARDTGRIVRQNFGLAITYNCIAIPLAVAGLVTPLIAALAMSASSVAVIANALRLNRAGNAPDHGTAATPQPMEATA